MTTKQTDFDAEQFGKLLRDTTLATIKAHGVEDSGAFSHYQTLANEDRIYGEEQQSFVDFVVEHIPIEREIHEIGDGSGLTSLALFRRGYNCINISANGQRSRFSQTLAGAIKATYPNMDWTYRILMDKFPSPLTDLMMTRRPAAALVSYDCVNETFANSEAAVVTKAARYSDLIIDLRRFTTPRETDEEQRNLLDMFMRRDMQVVKLDDPRRTHSQMLVERNDLVVGA